ncbi:hypothetical protein [Streptomyces ardesiacus]|uniref:hypothetical protein n=1 Tax=Streptomyces ardesiacus TaxID=285564 RepID=UPI00364A69CE
MNDPIASVVAFLRSLPDLPPGSVTGDMNAREVGDPTVYVEPAGGYMALRDSMSRIYVYYECYDTDKEKAAERAFLVRRHLLRGLRDITVGGLYFLDSRDEEMPRYDPDSASREHVYAGEVSLFYIEP